ncbi:alpha-1,2-mannosyltransferase [Coprinopsis sp. MPI-PUGE-AT-0042]|nr:alpha-1,2-mannosyltransferase [Coprinopsis sp. MPI-PUGE-AT-0042]
MNTPARYILVALFLIISLHYLLSFTHEAYGQATSLSNLKDKISQNLPKPKPEVPQPLDSVVETGKRANASFVILCRNSDMGNIIRSVREMEDRFNRKYHYPYVFLNEEPFTDEVQEALEQPEPCQNGVWSDSLMIIGTNPNGSTKTRLRLAGTRWSRTTSSTAGSVSYRNMCRFNSGFFFRHPLMLKYRWYWRIEPDVHFHCNINHDPFLYMEQNNKTYGFTITLYEYEATIPTMWGHVRDFMRQYPEYVAENNAMGFMEKEDNRYNLCHFWSNFEIADMDFWRSKAYMDFFEFLDSKGGFYYERWGDAPVHSIAAAMMLPKEKIHFFDEIAYGTSSLRQPPPPLPDFFDLFLIVPTRFLTQKTSEHSPYVHCSSNKKTWEAGMCSCDPKKSFDNDGYSCMNKWHKFMGRAGS